MTKQEFLTDLQRALTNKIDATEISAHVNYYREYIETEVRKGRAEEEVTNELGSPRLIAKSILSAAAMEQKSNGNMDDAGAHAASANSGFRERVNGLPGWLWLLIVILVIVVLIFLLTSVLRVFLPILLPLVLILLLVRWWNSNK